MISENESELQRLFRKEERYGERNIPGSYRERETREEIRHLKQEIKILKKEAFESVLAQTQAFVGTLTSIETKAIRDKFFDVVVIDEATQATEPLTWVPLARARKVVMAGDHFQLPPTVRSKEAEKRGLGVTLFERFYNILAPEFRTLLERQYRMNEKIMGFSSREFYEGLLVADESVKDQTLAGIRGVKKSKAAKEPILFIDTAGRGFEERLEEGSESRYNPEEAEIVISQLNQMLEMGVPPSGIAVISPYSAQVRLLVSKIPHPEIEIDSVDGFQGREKELVIVCLVRSNMEGEMGFLTDTRRMNVAMTRARRKLIVIGDSSTISGIKFYKDFMKYVSEVGGYSTTWDLE
jgi:predicted DNA helicase